MPFRRPAGRGLRKRAVHNGTESRKMLPLRQRGRGRMPSRRPAGRVLRKMAFHNGTESRAAVAEKGNDGNGVRKAYRMGAEG